MQCENVGQIVELLEGIRYAMGLLGIIIVLCTISLLLKGYTIYPRDK